MKWLLVAGAGVAGPAALLTSKKARAASDGPSVPQGAEPPKGKVEASDTDVPKSVSDAKEPITCSDKYYPALRMYGSRRPDQIRLIVIHSTEGKTAEGAASWWRNPAAQGSAHIVVGNDGCLRAVDDLRIPAGAEGTNKDGLHLEVAGFAKWTRAEWEKNGGIALENASAILGQWAKKYGIPLKLLTAEEIKNPSVKGITTHVAVVKALKKGTHWDPGPGFPLDRVIEGAKAYI